jgi:hypothetical protein
VHFFWRRCGYPFCFNHSNSFLIFNSSFLIEYSIMKKIIFSLFCLSAIYSATAQTDADALRFSTMQVGSTARSMAMGGTLGAIGADFSVASSNPAGLANMRQGEFAFSPGFHFTMTEATADGGKTSLSDNSQTFIFPHLGLVLPYVNDDHKWKVVVPAIGVQRIGNFNQRSFYSTTSTGSIADYFLSYAQGKNTTVLDSYQEGLAFNTYLLDTTAGSTNNYITALDDQNALIQKSQTIKSKGGADEVIIALAGNYNNRFNIGATLGIPIVDYTETKIYKETNTNATDNFRSVEFKEYLNTSGVGVNLKVGATYRVAQALRIGVAVHTPTYYTLRDTFNNTMRTNTLQASGLVSDSAKGSIYNYNLATPTRLIGSASLVFKPNREKISGMINGEVEYMNMSTARFILDGTSTGDKQYQSALNNNIKNKYTNVITARIGGELAIDVFRIRAGYAQTNSPFKSGVVSQSIVNQQFTGGIGIRERSYFIDLAYANTLGGSEYTPYLTTQSPIKVARKLDNSTIVLTVGFKFN